MKELIADWPGKRDGAGNEHAAVYHMLDVAAVGEILLSRIDMPAPQRDALVFLIALHDLGKIGAPFRAMLRDGVRQDLRHWEYTEVLLHKHDAQIENFIGGKQQRREHLYAATAGHHGRPPTADLSNPRLWRALGAEAQRDSAEVIATFAQLWPGASLDDLTREDALRLQLVAAGMCCRGRLDRLERRVVSVCRRGAGSWRIPRSRADGGAERGRGIRAVGAGPQRGATL